MLCCFVISGCEIFIIKYLSQATLARPPAGGTGLRLDRVRSDTTTIQPGLVIKLEKYSATLHCPARQSHTTTHSETRRDEAKSILCKDYY